jgi:endonuclease III related protein
MVGALLTQQTTWESVERVLAELKRRDLMSVDAIVNLPLEELGSILRPAGFYRQKARNIRAAASYIQQNYASDPTGLLAKDLLEARKELLSLPGIGNETADAILLFAGSRPKFVAAVYVSRVLKRLAIYDSDDYLEVQRFMEARVLPDPRRYAHLYALLVHHARTTCRSRPRCEACFLRGECGFSG